MSEYKNWWIGDSGINMLKGDPDDESNLPILGNDLILEFLHRIPQAREDLVAMLPRLTPAEQDRLYKIIADAPFIEIPITPLPERSDAFMRSMNTAGVYTSGPGGGTGRGRLPR